MSRDNRSFMKDEFNIGDIVMEILHQYKFLVIDVPSNFQGHYRLVCMNEELKGETFGIPNYMVEENYVRVD